MGSSHDSLGTQPGARLATPLSVKGRCSLGQLHQHARHLLGRAFANQHFHAAEPEPWTDAELHRLKSLADAAGPDFSAAGREAVDALNQAREALRAARAGGNQQMQRELYDGHWQRAASQLDDLATRAEIRNL